MKRYERLRDKCLASHGLLLSYEEEIGGRDLRVCGLERLTNSLAPDCKYCNILGEYPICGYEKDVKSKPTSYQI